LHEKKPPAYRRGLFFRVPGRACDQFPEPSSKYHGSLPASHSASSCCALSLPAMEDQASFDLSGAIQKWRRDLAQSAAFHRADLDELEAHLRDAIPALQAAGLSSEEAFVVASRRIGTRHTLESEFGKINSGHSVRNRPWLAGLLQIVTPGLGNLYTGRPVRALILHVAVLFIGLFLALALLWLPGPLNLLIPVAAAIVGSSTWRPRYL